MADSLSTRSWRSRRGPPAAAPSGSVGCSSANRAHQAVQFVAQVVARGDHSPMASRSILSTRGRLYSVSALVTMQPLTVC